MFTLVVNALPIPRFTHTPTSSDVGQDVRFDASPSLDPDGTVTSYSWDFRDGTSGAGQTVAHEFQSPGTYTVTLTVTDNTGATQKISRTLTISQGPSFTAFLSSRVGIAGIVAAVLLILVGALLFVRSRGKGRYA